MSLAKDTSIRVVGKLKDKVLYYRRDGSYHERSYFIPVQPGTAPQVAWWNKFAAGVSAWQALTAEQKNEWNKKAYPLKMSGFNYFMRKHLLA